MSKDNDDIKKEIEELEKLIEEVKKQNEEEKKKQTPQKKTNQLRVFKIDLSQEYSPNFFLNLLIGFVINFLVIFALFELVNLAYIANYIFVLLIALILTLYEEVSRKYLAKKYLSVVVYSAGFIYFFVNVILFYFLDLVIFGRNFDFYNHWYPLIFVMLLQMVRVIIRTIYIRIRIHFLKKRKKRR